MSRERRAYRRHPIRWPAELRFAEGERVPASIEDICVGGMFATPGQSGYAISRPEDTRLHVRFHDPVRGSTREIAARIARASRNGLGLAFDHPQTELVALLQSIAGRGEEPSERGPREGAETPRAEWVRELCRKHAGSFCEEHLPRFSDDVIDELFQRSRGMHNPAEQASVFHAYQRLRTEAPGLPGRFRAALFAEVDAMGRPEEESEAEELPSSPDELELVDDREFEDWLLRSELVNEAEGRNRQPMHLLNRRLSFVLDTPMDESSNPLAPEGFARVLSEVLSLEQLPAIAVRTIYERFARQVLERLGSLYEAINDELREADILPEAEREPLQIRMLGGGRTRHGAGHLPHLPATAGNITADGALSNDMDSVVLPTLPSQEGTPAAPQLADIARTLQGLTTELARSRQTASAGGPGVEDTQSSTAASALFPRLEGAMPSAPGDVPFSDALDLRDLPERQHAQLAAVEQWFREIQTDPATPAYLREWSVGLAVLAARQQLNDGGFLEGTATPVNRLMNAVEKAGLALDSMPASAAAPLRESLDATLQAAMAEGSPQRLQEAAAEIERRVAPPLEDRSTQMDRMAEQIAGQERLERAGELVDAALAERLEGRRIPRLLAELVDNGWRELLVLIRLRDGERHENWRRCLAVVDRLLTGLGHDGEPPRPIRDPDRVIRYIRHQLHQFGRLTARMEETVAAIATVVLAISHGEPAPITLEYIEYGDSKNDKPPVGSLWEARARLLRVGEWLVTEQGDEPLQLQWISGDGQRFVFVDRSGHEARQLGLEELASALQGGARVADDLEAPFTERQWRQALIHAHDALIQQATRDPLTGMLNRQAFERALEQLAQYRAGQRYAIVQLGLEDLERVNREAGHTAGDRFLRRAANLVRRAAGAAGIVARIDGDEFAAVIDVPDDETAQMLAERLRRSIARLPVRIDGNVRRDERAVTAVVMVIDTDEGTAGHLLERLSQVCDQTRAENPGRTTTLPPPSPEPDIDEEQLCRLIDGAIEAENLSLRAQRIEPLAAEGDAEQRYELFAALRDSNGNQTLTPARFLGVARQRGRMPRLDAVMLRHGMTLAQRLARRDGQPVVVHVNLGAASINHPVVLAALRRLAPARRQGQARICIEVSEAVAAGNLEAVVHFMERARSLGSELCVDGFGTMLATYDFLRLLPVDLFKLDAHFVRRVDTDKADRAMARTIAEMAHLLHRRVIAAGVEERELTETLRGLGMDYLQGYAIQRPQPLR
ncbi:DUF1631 family protein [Arhodomonas sp. SL1]|uniref:DUF1631 family protein n=1 Tax=Arhodomonas sp. SL1 TaxID=3425691 RepID=UPI003F8834DE